MTDLEQTLLTTKESYEEAYKKDGANSQRRYPNEELVRFISRTYQNTALPERKNKKVLEVGCGSCGNLWMIAKEGLDAYGLDLSPKALEIGKEVLKNWGVESNLREGSMEELPYDDQYFDAVVDVLASFSLLTPGFEKYIKEVQRVLKPGGRFFIFTLSTGSDAFKNFAPAKKIEKRTLNGIHRKDSPYYGCFYPHQFYEVNELSSKIDGAGFCTERKELLSRTYRNLAEVFEYISLEAFKI